VGGGEGEGKEEPVCRSTLPPLVVIVFVRFKHYNFLFFYSIFSYELFSFFFFSTSSYKKGRTYGGAGGRGGRGGYKARDVSTEKPRKKRAKSIGPNKARSGPNKARSGPNKARAASTEKIADIDLIVTKKYSSDSREEVQKLSHQKLKRILRVGSIIDLIFEDGYSLKSREELQKLSLPNLKVILRDCKSERVGVAAELTLAQQIDLVKEAAVVTSNGKVFLEKKLVVDLGTNDEYGRGANFGWRNELDGTIVASLPRGNEAIVIQDKDMRGSTNVYPHNKMWHSGVPNSSQQNASMIMVFSRLSNSAKKTYKWLKDKGKGHDVRSEFQGALNAMKAQWPEYEKVEQFLSEGAGEIRGPGYNAAQITACPEKGENWVCLRIADTVSSRGFDARSDCTKLSNVAYLQSTYFHSIVTDPQVPSTLSTRLQIYRKNTGGMKYHHDYAGNNAGLYDKGSLMVTGITGVQ